MANVEKISKATFVRQYPDLTPLEVEAKAKEAGLDIPAGYVSNIRSSDKASAAKKKKQGGGASKGAKKAAVAPKAKSKPAAKSSSNGMSKSAFIRSLPGDTSAKEAVEMAKAAGMAISEEYYYSVRSASKRGSSKGSSKGASKAATAPAASKGAQKAATKSAAPASKATHAPMRRGGAGSVKEVLELAIRVGGLDGAGRLLEEAAKRLELIIG